MPKYNPLHAAQAKMKRRKDAHLDHYLRSRIFQGTVTMGTVSRVSIAGRPGIEVSSLGGAFSQGSTTAVFTPNGTQRGFIKRLS